MISYRIGSASALAGVLLSAAGCLERTETITVARDGGVTIDLRYSGDPQSFDRPEALPGEKSGWRIQRRSETDEEGKVTEIWTSRRRFEPREKLPSNFGTKDDPNTDLYLSFPTTVRHDRRADGMYLHFRRVYEPRKWAYVQFWRDHLVDDEVQAIMDKPVEELADGERVRLVKALVGVELFKQVELAGAALEDCGQDVPQDVWLRARAAMLSAVEKTDWEDFVRRALAIELKEERDEYFAGESRRLLDEAYAAFLDELLAAAGDDEPLHDRFDAAFDRAKTHYDITSQLGSDHFKIHVNMPGELIAHNADKIADDGSAVWEFDGKAFRDRPLELMVTTRLPATRDDK